jgi:dTDP-4-amino-4,6-dideoxygalactose transaminase
MQKLEKMLELRRRNSMLLSRILSSKAKKGIRIPQESSDRKFNWYLYTVALDGNRDAVKDVLVKDNIGATVYYDPPVHTTPFYARLAPDTNLPSTDWAADHVLSLPVHPHVSEQDIEYIAQSTARAVGSQ